MFESINTSIIVLNLGRPLVKNHVRDVAQKAVYSCLEESSKVPLTKNPIFLGCCDNRR